MTEQKPFASEVENRKNGEQMICDICAEWFWLEPNKPIEYYQRVKIGRGGKEIPIYVCNWCKKVNKDCYKWWK